MAITRFNEPISSYAYQSPFQEIDFRSIMALGLGKQQQYDIQEERVRQDLLTDVKSPVGGGDVEAYNQYIDTVKSDLGKIKQQYPDYTTPEFKSAYNDFILNKQMSSPLESFATTKSKYQESIKELQENQHAPDFVKYNIKKRHNTYLNDGTQGLIDKYGSADFGSLKGWEDAPDPGTWLEEQIAGFSKEMLEGGYEGYPEDEILSYFGYDENGVLQGIPNWFTDSPTGVGKVFDMMNEYRYDKWLSGNPDKLAMLAQSENPEMAYQQNLQNFKLNSYHTLAQKATTEKASKELNSTMFNKQYESLKNREKLGDLYNNVVTDILDQPRTNVSLPVAQEMLDLVYDGKNENGKDIYSWNLNKNDEVIVRPGNTSQLLQDFKNILDIDDTMSSARNKAEEITSSIDDIEDMRYRIENVPGDAVTNPNYHQTISSLQNSINNRYSKAIEALNEYKEYTGSNIEIPDNINDLDTIQDLKNRMYKDYEKLNSKKVDLIRKTASDEYMELLTKDVKTDTDWERIGNYEEEIRDRVSQLTEVGQSLSGISTNLPIRDNAKYEKVNISGIPYIKIQAEVPADRMNMIWEGMRESGVNIPKRKGKNISKEYMDDYGNWFTYDKSRDVYFMDIYKPIDNLTRDQVIKAYEAYNPGIKLKSKEEQDVIYNDYIAGNRVNRENIQNANVSFE